MAALVALALAGCSSTALLNGLEPRQGQTISRDIPYAPGARQGLDVYRPASATGGAPVVVFIYGGGWDGGNRGMYGFVGAALAAQGFVAVVPDYRLYPAVRYPAFLQDNALAVRWAHDHAAEYGGDPAKLVLMGHSAGAYEAVMLALDPRWLMAVGLNPRRDLRGAIGIAGPYDFKLDTPKLQAIFGPPDGAPQTQPIGHVDGRGPPLLLLTDGADKVVRPGNTERLAARVRAAGGRVETKTYPGLSHTLVIGAIAAPLRFLAPTLKDSAAFVRRATGTPAP